MFGFPSHIRTTYKTNFLKTTTLQLKFFKTPAVLTVKDDLIKILSPLFPNCTNLPSNTIIFGLANSNTKISPNGNELSGFSFSSKDSFKQFNITEESIIITYTGQSYSNFETMWDEINLLIKTVLDLLLIKEFNWVSIRKINIIQLKIDNLNEAYIGLGSIFNNALVNQYLTIPSNNLLVSGLSNFILSGEGKNLRLVYGLIPSNKEVKELVLDIDLFCDKQTLSFDNLKAKVFEINQEVFNVFHWSLLDKTVNHLNEI